MNGAGIRALSTSVRRWSEWQARRSLRRMRRLGQVAGEPTLVGTPHLEINGSIRLGRGVTVVSEPVQTHFVVSRGAHLEIGDRVTIGSACGIACHSHIAIGSDSELGTGVLILDSDYHVAGNETGKAEPLPIAIGSRVRIADNVIVLRGSRIEDDARIDAGSVVSGFVSPGAHVGGVPARLLDPAIAVDRSAGTLAVVLMLAQQTFRLAAAPLPSQGPGEIAEWDSLGSLSFLLALEDSFEISLDVDEAGRVATLADVAAMLDRTLKRRGEGG